MSVCAADERLQFHVVDVFSDRRYAGNALAVVLDGDQLTLTQRQAIAREFNLSETVFPVAPQTATADYSLKIHTPRVELPFGGHPSLGAAWLLVQQGRLAAGRFTQESGGATYALTVGEVEMLSTLEGPIPTVEQIVDASASLAAVNLTAADQVGLPAATVTAGAAFQVLAVRRDALRRLTARPDRLDGALDGASGIAVISLDETAIRARVITSHGNEDPGTGSAALGLGAFLVVNGFAAPDGRTHYTVTQGVEIGRRCLIHGTVDAESGIATCVSIAGRVAPVMSGFLYPPSTESLV